MKKKCAALLCGVMCVGAFTGCSGTELGYLKMSKDMLDTMQMCKVEGTMQVDVDFDALGDYANDVAKATRDEIGTIVSEGDLPAGKKSVTLDYDMNMNLNTLEYDMAFDVTYEGKTYDMGDLYYSLTDGVYVTSDTVWGVYQMAGDVMEGYEDSYLFTDAFGKDLQATLAQDKYIALVSAEEMTGLDMDEVMPEKGFGEIYDAAMTFYEDVLKGFDSGMVKEIPNGYAIEADGQQAAEMLVKLLDFAAENPDQMIDATEKYLTTVMDQMATGTAEETAAAKEEIKELFAAARASRDDFIAAAAEMSDALAEAIKEDGIAEALRSISYKAEETKTSNGFASSSVIAVQNAGKQVLSLTSKSTVQKSNGTIAMPKSGISIDALSEKLGALENKYNPVTGVSATWGWEGNASEAELYAFRGEVGFLGNDFATADLIVKDGRAYLPLRVICDTLGETVGWENATKTPYVMQDGKRIDMKGLLQDGKAFVGVRDFEKLGYTVSYTSYEEGYKEAVIEK